MPSMTSSLKFKTREEGVQDVEGLSHSFHRDAIATQTSADGGRFDGEASLVSTPCDSFHSALVLTAADSLCVVLELTPNLITLLAYQRP